jgi:serine/threonine protein kinase
LAEQVVKIGEVVEGRYKILRPIAEGGMGTVYLAEHWLIKRKVAMKILRKDLATDVVMLRRFMNEALAAGTLGHPNIVESTDMGFTRDDVPYIVFEYLQGCVLADEIALGPLMVVRALAIAHQIASALAAAHDANIIHRDLKSDNIFLTVKGDKRDHVKVLDFGISRFQSAKDRTSQGGNLLGTPEFMAPEQVMTPDAIDHRIDIYALGVILYEMLTGSVPFRLTKENDLEAAHELLTRVVHEPPAPFVCRDAPPGLVDFVNDKLLAKDPASRFQTMVDVQRALEAFGTVLPTGPIRMRRATTQPVDRAIADLSDQTLTRSELSQEDLVREVKALGKRWSLREADLVLDLHSRDMKKLAAVVAAAAEVADEMDHHPDVALSYPRLAITLASARTVVDLVFAARLEQWLRENGW